MVQPDAAIASFARWLTGRRVLLGLLRRRADARLAAVQDRAGVLGLAVPEATLRRLAGRRHLLGLLRRSRAQGERIIVLDMARCGDFTPPVLDRIDRPVAVMIAPDWPGAAVASASATLVEALVESLVVLGYRVICAGIGDPPDAADRDRLGAMGAACLDLPANGASLGAFIERWGTSVAVFVLAGHAAVDAYFDMVRDNVPDAKIVFHMADLRSLSEHQRARWADAAIVASASERMLAAAAIPGAYVVELPPGPRMSANGIAAARHRIHEMMIGIGLPCITPPGCA